MHKGCSQGSIIGPAFWNFCMDKLLIEMDKSFAKEDAETIAYADDLVVLIKRNSRADIERVGNEVIGKLKEWCELHKLRVSATKTTAMLMKGTLDKERMPRLKLEGKNIKYSTEVRYLGIIINNKLNFIAHVKYLRDKLTKFVMMIRRLVRDEWGLKKNVLKVLYRAVVVPITTYGATAWFDKVFHSLVRKHLLAAQRIMLLVLTKACRTVSTSSMQVISGLMPLNLEVVLRGLIGKVKRNITVGWNNYTYNRLENKNDLNLKEEISLIKKKVIRSMAKKME